MVDMSDFITDKIMKMTIIKLYDKQIDSNLT